MQTRKSLLISFIFIIICFTSGCSPDAVDIYGRPVRISNYKGKWVVINYWATWCSPCIQEIPALNDLATYYKDKVVVLGVNVDHLNNNVLRNLAQGYGVKYVFLGRFPIEKWGGKLEQLPISYIFDTHGKLYKTLVGPQKLANFQAIMNLPDITYE